MKKILFFLLCLGFTFPLAAQMSIDRDVKSSAGTYSSSTSFNLSWTIGEMAIMTRSGTNLMVTEGFQQPDGEFVGTENQDLRTEIQVFPNPVTDRLYFEITVEQSQEMIMNTYDLQGKSLFPAEKLRINRQYKGELDFEAMPAGIWFIRFINPENQEVQTFQVRKL